MKEIEFCGISFGFDTIYPTFYTDSKLKISVLSKTSPPKKINCRQGILLLCFLTSVVTDP